MTQPPIGVIGFGNMAEAIVAGILDDKLAKASDIYALDNSQKRMDLAKNKYKIHACPSVKELCQNTNVILLAVKPQHINDVLPALEESLKKHLIITIVTGIETKYYQKILGRQAKVIRVMPNTPALIGQGAAAYFANKNCSVRDQKICENIFNSVGLILEVKKEKLIDAVTAISGSGPAFVYQYAQSVMDSAKKLGLSADMAKRLVLQTLLGATQMMLNSQETPGDLTKKVTSKGGTTLAGLEVLKKKGFAKILDACMKKAAKRAEELSKQFGK